MRKTLIAMTVTSLFLSANALALGRLADAQIIDRMVRADPDHAYEPEFYERFATEAGWYPGR